MHLQNVLEQTYNLNIHIIMTTLNRLYFYLINSGSLVDIYLSVFIKNEGMIALRKFQEFCINYKIKFKKYDYDEIRYIVSILILSLYKHFKLNDNYEQNNNPFVVFADDKIVV